MALRASLPRGQGSFFHRLSSTRSRPQSIFGGVLDATFPRILSRDAVTLSAGEADGFNRWSLFPRAFLIQVPCGGLNAWSMWQAPLSTNLGVVAPAASDWSLEAVGSTFPWFGVGWGLSMAFMGPWIDRAGPRYSTIVGGALIGGGHLVSALGCYTELVQFVWLGWGVMAGIGTGLCYTAPIGTLLRWFPDKKGLATGFAGAPYALGGLIAAPLIQKMHDYLFRAPTYAGTVADVEMKLEAGKQFVRFEDKWCEAVVAGAADISKLSDDVAMNLAEGVYLVGTGDSGSMMTLATLGSAWFAMIATGGWSMYQPPPQWSPPGWKQPVASLRGSTEHVGGSVSASTAMRTPQFWLMWLTIAGNASAGVLVIPAAKVMLVDIFGSVNPSIVTAGFSTAFVSGIALGNCAGRMGWAAISDHIGRKNAMFVCSLSLPACMLVPQLVRVAVDGSLGTAPLYMFCGTSLLIGSWYGGSLALLPSYATSVFGPKEFAAIYGRLMTGWSAVAVASPSLLNVLRSHSTEQAIYSLAATTPPDAFERAFKAPVEQLPALLEAKAVTIARLMEIAPAGTIDPAPFVYDSTFYAISGVIATSAVANALITKVDPKHFMVEEGEKEEKEGRKHGSEKSLDSK